MDTQRELMLQAVNLLVGKETGPAAFQALDATSRLAKLYPVQLTGEHAPLNTLIQLRRQDEAAFERVMGLVHSKRAAAGIPPLVEPPDEKFNKTEYMREFMEQKRQRQRRAVDIENYLRPERDMLKGRARLDFMDAAAAKWKAELDTVTARARQTHGQRLPKDVLDTVRTQFWAGVDKQLDEAEADARARLKRRV